MDYCQWMFKPASGPVEVHARQAAIPWFDMDLKILVTDGTKLVAAVMHHVVAPAIAVAQKKQRGLIDAVGNPIIRYFVLYPAIRAAVVNRSVTWIISLGS